MAELKIKLPFNMPRLNSSKEEFGENNPRLYILIGTLIILVFLAFVIL